MMPIVFKTIESYNASMKDVGLLLLYSGFNVKRIPRKRLWKSIIKDKNIFESQISGQPS